MRSVFSVIYAALVCASLPAQSPAPESAFLVERVTITTRNGVVGFPAGTRVQIVSRHGAKVSVKAEDKILEVRPNQLTDDVELGHRLGQRDASQQLAIRQEITTNAVQAPEGGQAQTPSANEKLPQSSNRQAIDPRLENIHIRRERLKIELDRVKYEQKGLPKPNSSKFKSSHGRKKVVSIESSPKAFALEQKRKDLEKQIFELNEEEKRVKIDSR